MILCHWKFKSLQNYQSQYIVVDSYIGTSLHKRRKPNVSKGLFYADKAKHFFYIKSKKKSRPIFWSAKTSHWSVSAQCRERNCGDSHFFELCPEREIWHCVHLVTFTDVYCKAGKEFTFSWYILSRRKITLHIFVLHNKLSNLCGSISSSQCTTIGSMTILGPYFPYCACVIFRYLSFHRYRKHEVEIRKWKRIIGCDLYIYSYSLQLQFCCHSVVSRWTETRTKPVVCQPSAYL